MPNLFDILTACVAARDYTAAIQFIQENRNDIHKIEVDGNPNPGKSPIHVAVVAKNGPLLSAFLSVPRLTLNSNESISNLTPLHGAILVNWEEGVRLLLSVRELDLHRQGGNDFLSPLEFAQQQQRTEIATLIRAEIERRRVLVDAQYSSGDEELADSIHASTRAQVEAPRNFNRQRQRNRKKTSCRSSDYQETTLISGNTSSDDECLARFELEWEAREEDMRRRQNAHKRRERARRQAQQSQSANISTTSIFSATPTQSQAPVSIRATEFLNAAESGLLTTVQQYINSLGRNDHLALNVRREVTRETALMLAAAGGHRTIVDVLIDAKADLVATNNSGFTAAQLAEQNGHVEIASYLIRLITDLSSKTSTTSASPAIPIKNPNNFAARLEKLKRRYTIPPEYICPISQEICNDPIEIHGDLYDRVSLIGYFDAHPGATSLLNPLTKDPTKPILKTELTKRTSQVGESAIRRFVAEQERLDAAEQSTSSQVHADQDDETLRPALTK